MIGQQPQAEDGRNFTDPAESYKTGEQSHFRTGLNELVFEIKNFRDPSGFDYRAVVNYMPSTPVLIDIKPGEYPNTINLGSNGVVPVAILSTLIFDATQVDPLTVTSQTRRWHCVARERLAVIKDVNQDGLLDLLVHVETEDALNFLKRIPRQYFSGKRLEGNTSWAEIPVRIVP